ncbi:MAG: 50S ribosomal protein L10 [Coxiella sp. RIFCSPHIGHO2_12_FULL_44_14]|nr:MAG: 50S ribosomal protein L10 [Coxiella sp. RIFCSPHIGHO2_12_FULL_44_14]
MPLNLQQKKVIVAELATVAGQATSVVAADYRGLTVSEMTELRTTARRAGISMRVYRNTLACLAVKGTSFACLHEVLNGPTVLFFSHQDPGAAARLVQDFMKEHELLVVKALALGGSGLLGPDKLKAVASLPSREVVLTQLVFVMKAPIRQWVCTVNEPVARMVRVMAAVRDQKQAASS